MPYFPIGPQLSRVKKFYEKYPFPHSNYSLTELQKFYSEPILSILDPQGLNILDVGCGTGEMSLLLASKGAHVTGIDLSESSIQKATTYAQHLGLTATFKQENFLTWNTKEKFDVVLCIGVLHHTPYPKASFSILVDYVKPGGMLVVSMYNQFMRLRLKFLKALLPSIIRQRIYKNKNVYMDSFYAPIESEHTVKEIFTWFETERFVINNIHPPKNLINSLIAAWKGIGVFTISGIKRKDEDA